MGHLQSGQTMDVSNRLACVTLFSERLTSMEVEQLSIVCSSLAAEVLPDLWLPKVPNLLFFSPLEKSKFENALNLPPICSPDARLTLLGSDNCTDGSKAGTAFTPYGFRAVGVKNNTVIGSVLPFRSDTFSWTIAFYLNNIQPDINARILTLLTNDENYSLDFTDSILELKNRTSTIIGHNISMFPEVFVALTRTHESPPFLSLYLGNANDNSQIIKVNEKNPYYSVLIPKDSGIVLGGGKLSPQDSGYLFPKEMACFYMFDQALTEPEINQLPTHCRIYMGGEIPSAVATTVTTTTESTATSVSFVSGSSVPNPVPSSSSSSQQPPTTTAKSNDPTIFITNDPILELEESILPNVDVTSTNLLSMASIMEHCHDFDPNLAVPPNNNQSNDLQVMFQIDQLQAVDTLNQMISVGGMLMLHWQVDTCNANSSTVFTERGRQPIYVSSAQEVWTPKLKFMSSADYNVFMQGKLFGEGMTAHLTYSGGKQIVEFWYLIYGKFDTSCTMGLSKFPFDQQKCTLIFQPTIFNQLLNIKQENVRYYWKAASNGEWNVEFNKLKYRVQPVRYNGGSYDIVVTRSSNYYVMYLALPVFILGLVILASFLLPVNETNRPLLTVTVLLALYFAQNEVLARLPVIDDNIVFGSYILQMSGFAACIAMLQLVLIFINNTTTLFSRKFCKGKIQLIQILNLAIAVAAIFVFVVIHINVLTTIGFR